MEAFGPPNGPPLGPLGRLLGVSWGVLGRPLAGLERLLGAFWLLGSPWALISKVWGRPRVGFGGLQGHVLAAFCCASRFVA